MQQHVSVVLKMEVLSRLGAFLSDSSHPEIQAAIERATIENSWFTKDNTLSAIEAIRTQYLQKEALDYLVNKYCIDDNIQPLKVALIPAGNIPLVGWHDLMCCFLAGHIAVIKFSEKDTVLMQFLINKIIEWVPETAVYFKIVDRIKDYDAAIATGSNISAQQFKHYFKDVPHIIRANRNSLAVLTGQENLEQLQLLAGDVFSYFGLGCRNVSKIFVPEDYNLSVLIEAFDMYEPIIHHNKYKNNYDYNLALMLLNREKFLQAPFFLLKEAEAIVSRIASLHYHKYNSLSNVVEWIQDHDEEIQCVVCTSPLEGIDTVWPGEAQCPGIDIWADGVDTLQFLLMLPSRSR